MFVIIEATVVDVLPSDSDCFTARGADFASPVSSDGVVGVVVLAPCDVVTDWRGTRMMFVGSTRRGFLLSGDS